MSRSSRERIRREVKEITEQNPTGDPHSLQMKTLSRLNAEAILELIDTLDMIDASNKKLEESSLQLANRTFWVQVVSVGIAIIALLVALFIRNSSR